MLVAICALVYVAFSLPRLHANDYINSKQAGENYQKSLHLQMFSIHADVTFFALCKQSTELLRVVGVSIVSYVFLCWKSGGNYEIIAQMLRNNSFVCTKRVAMCNEGTFD